MGQYQTEYTMEDLTIREVSKTIGGVKMELREADGKTTSRYQSAAIRGSKFAKGGKEVTVGDDIGHVDIILVSGCLFYADGSKDNGKNVPESVVSTWPGRVIKALAKEAKELSGLDNDAEDDPVAIQQEIDRLTKRLEELKSDPLGKSSSGITAGSA